MELSEAVKELRAHCRLTQSEFGAKLGVSLPTIQRYERYGPTSEALLPLAGAARECGRLDLADLFEREFRAQHGIEEPKREPEEYTPEERRYTDMVVQLLRDPDPGSQIIKTMIEGFTGAMRQRKAMRRGE